MGRARMIGTRGRTPRKQVFVVQSLGLRLGNGLEFDFAIHGVF